MPNARRMPALALLFSAGVLLVAVSGRGDTPAPRAEGAQEVTVLGVLVSPQTGVPAVVLQGRRDGRTVAISIGPAEATGIAFPLAKRTPPRPLTHDLFLTLFGRLDVTVTRMLSPSSSQEASSTRARASASLSAASISSPCGSEERLGGTRT